MTHKPWHLHTHDEKLAKFAKCCQWCGKQYVDHTALYVHETRKCPKRERTDVQSRWQIPQLPDMQS